VILGCSSSIDDVCVLQDDECAAIFCDNELGIAEFFKKCNDACEETTTSIVEGDGFKCNCLDASVLSCPTVEKISKRSVEKSHLTDYLLPKKLKVS
jgi:hypothetical protein